VRPPPKARTTEAAGIRSIAADWQAACDNAAG
jgi:hypothetical protein